MPHTKEGNYLFHFIAEGEVGRKLMPCSEVCMHMEVADQYLDFEVIRSRHTLMVQLYLLPSENGESRFLYPFSAPITTGEAGLYDAESHGMETDKPHYYYPHELRDENDEVASLEPYNLARSRGMAVQLEFDRRYWS